jgi:hypothetical protein
MDSPISAVLAEVTCTWGDDEASPGASGRTTALLVHMGREMLVLEASDPRQALPPLGSRIRVIGEAEPIDGRLAEHGRAGRFLVSVGDRPVRRALRLRVSLPGTLRTAALPESVEVEIVDLTTGGARIRGIELSVGSQVTLGFTPPGRTDPVSVRATVAHGTHRAQQPWIGVRFRLVAMRGGR